MIAQNKLNAALQALNHILVRARWMAYEADCCELAELLDAAETLPSYLSEEGDFTHDFVATLKGIAGEFESCAHVADQFKGIGTSVN